MNSLPAAALTAREYLRVSAEGERSIPEQRQDNKRAADREGFALGTPYQDQGSASRYATKGRDGYDRLMGELTSGQFGAEVLMLWESSRGSRRVGEWVTLIELCEDRGVRIYVTTHSRLYDPGNPRDRRSLLEDAVDSEYESAKISGRTLRGLNANARDGKPHGICPFGFKRDYVTLKGKLVPVRQYAHPDEAPLVVELFTRTRAGHSFRAIARDWAAKGITGRRGKTISPETMRDLALNVAYIGLRSTKGTTVEASWERLVSDELFYEVQAMLAEPSRFTGNSGAPRHEFTGAVVCDVCSGPITVSYKRDTAAYVCKGKGCVRVDKAGVDEILTRVVVAHLNRPDAYEDSSDDGNDSQAAALRDQLAKGRADLREMEEAKSETLAEARILARSVERLEGKIKELEDQVRELSRPTALSTLFRPGGNVTTRWLRTPVSAQRAIAALLFTPTMLGQVRLTRSPAPGKRGDLIERVEFRRA